MLQSKREKVVDILDNPVSGTVCQFEFSDMQTLRCVNPRHSGCFPVIIGWEARRIPVLLALLGRDELAGNARAIAEEFQAIRLQ